MGRTPPLDRPTYRVLYHRPIARCHGLSSGDVPLDILCVGSCMEVRGCGSSVTIVNYSWVLGPSSRMEYGLPEEGDDIQSTAEDNEGMQIPLEGQCRRMKMKGWEKGQGGEQLTSSIDQHPLSLLTQPRPMFIPLTFPYPHPSIFGEYETDHLLA